MKGCNGVDAYALRRMHAVCEQFLLFPVPPTLTGITLGKPLSSLVQLTATVTCNCTQFQRLHKREGERDWLYGVSLIFGRREEEER